MPPTVECGAAFTVRVGIKCASGCAADGWPVTIDGHEGAPLAEALVGGEPWDGTDALYHAALELTAPDSDGIVTWEAVAPAIAGDDGRVDADSADDAPGHAEARTPFNVRAVPKPDCVLTVIAIDGERQTPISRAKVVAHPYRTLTDEHGVATLRLPKGSYRVFVSGREHFPFRRDCDIHADLTIRAELDVDREPSDAEIWS